ncbi:MAG TPA: membrane integrity-associated transporter subunit PqiC [Gammaproteobacteria bacterium]|nr:membrane integrity-associated transporter subunit PqiC [Gammaproteobacteria bacterium]
MQFLFVIILMLTTLLLGACGSTPPSHFYLLTPMATVVEAGDNSRHVGIGVGPLRFPEYLSRDTIVRYETDSRVTIAETQRWAEPLEYNFSRVLAENLSRLLQSDKVLRYPWAPWRKPDYQLVMDVMRFEAGDNGKVELVVQWALLEGKNKKPLLEKHSRFVQSATEDFDSIVNAHSQALAAFSQEVAAVIRQQR